MEYTKFPNAASTFFLLSGFNCHFTEGTQMIVIDVTPSNAPEVFKMFYHLSSRVSCPPCFGDWSPS